MNQGFAVMVIVLKENPDAGQLKKLTEWLENQGVEVRHCQGSQRQLLEVLGDTSRVDADRVSAWKVVEEVKRIQEPYRAAGRASHPEDTVIRLADGTRIGGGNFVLMAGPCSVESEEQICRIAEAVKAAGATVLRGGAFKPRTSPYSFQGLREEGMRMLLEARRRTGLPVSTEIMELSQLELFSEVDIIQVGARNMQNFELLRGLGQLRKPVLLKRGPSNTYQELLMSAEHILAGGNAQVILCERGIRTLETYTRNTLDLTAVPVLHKLSHLPVIVDPSHASGRSWLVPGMAVSAVAAGADGLMLEVHDIPEEALSDGQQAITPAEFAALVPRIHALRKVLGLDR